MMRYLSLLVCIVLLFGLLGSSSCITQRRIDKIIQTQIENRKEEFDSLGYAFISLYAYSFDSNYNERWISSWPHKYRIQDRGQFRVFEVFTAQKERPCKWTDESHFNRQNPNIFYYSKKGEVQKDGSQCLVEIDTLPFVLMDRKSFWVDSVKWDIYKYEANVDEYCHTIYWSDSLGLIKTYTPVRGERPRLFIECEVNFGDGKKYTIVKSIRAQFSGLDSFHTNCSGGLRYLNGYLID